LLKSKKKSLNQEQEFFSFFYFENKKKERIFAVRNENGNESRKKHQQDSEFRNVD
jgi:hypothetical protein